MNQIRIRFDRRTKTPNGGGFDLGRRRDASGVHDAAAVGHLVLVGVLAVVVVVDRVHRAQIQQQSVQHTHLNNKSLGK